MMAMPSGNPGDHWRAPDEAGAPFEPGERRLPLERLGANLDRRPVRYRTGFSEPTSSATRVFAPNAPVCPLVVPVPPPLPRASRQLPAPGRRSLSGLRPTLTLSPRVQCSLRAGPRCWGTHRDGGARLRRQVSHREPQGGQVMTELAIQGFRGRLIGPSDKDYDEARALYNGMIDKRPRLIARCVDAADVIAAVNFGRDTGLLLAIRGGGHNGPGLGSCDDGLVIDLSHDEERARRPGDAAPCGSIPAARPATSIMRPTPSAWPCRFGIVSQHRRRRPHPRRRHRLPHAQVRPDDRQPARGRRRAGRRQLRHRQQGRAPRSLLGAARRRRQLRRRHQLPVPGAPGRRWSTPGRSSGTPRTPRR